MTPDQIEELLNNELVEQFDPGYIKDVLECSEVLRLTGADSLLYHDGGIIKVLVEWKRKKD